MKNFLFPQLCKRIGWFIFIPALILGLYMLFGEYYSFSGILETVLNDFAVIGIALGSIFIVCSKEKCEDEMVQSIRLSSLLNSLYIYVSIIIIGTLFINGVDYLNFTFMSMAFLPIIYVVIFNIQMRQYNKMSDDEE